MKRSNFGIYQGQIHKHLQRTTVSVELVLVNKGTVRGEYLPQQIAPACILDFDFAQFLTLPECVLELGDDESITLLNQLKAKWAQYFDVPYLDELPSSYHVSKVRVPSLKPILNRVATPYRVPPAIWPARRIVPLLLSSMERLVSQPGVHDNEPPHDLSLNPSCMGALLVLPNPNPNTSISASAYPQWRNSLRSLLSRKLCSRRSH
ncbi:hypothetical protein Salat_1897800 [Sesamum alatum]|uniref:Uncharacterized protein n=1 Tax=Sesamum alatum TaxID=300844 RepID=A0AAE1Y3U9_9LAMI|nr:hypothetical protein Salat_1897800 [Sesamum alatum]